MPYISKVSLKTIKYKNYYFNTSEESIILIIHKKVHKSITNISANVQNYCSKLPKRSLAPP